MLDSNININKLLLSKNSPYEVVGKWLTTNGKGVVEIFKANDGTYQGKILGCKKRMNLNGVEIDFDIFNPNQNLRYRKVLGLIIITNFKFDGNDTWIDL